MRRAACDAERRGLPLSAKWRAVGSSSAPTPSPWAASSSFPTAEELFKEQVFEKFKALLPAPPILLPRIPGGRGHRVRCRFQLQREKIGRANLLIRSLNLLHAGFRCKCRTRDSWEGDFQEDPRWRAAVA